MKEKIFNEQLKLTVAYINSVAIGAFAWAVLAPLLSDSKNLSWPGTITSILIHLYARSLFIFLKKE